MSFNLRQSQKPRSPFDLSAELIQREDRL